MKKKKNTHKCRKKNIAKIILQYGDGSISEISPKVISRCKTVVANLLKKIEMETQPKPLPPEEIVTDLYSEKTDPAVILKGARKRQGLTQHELAKKLQSAQSFVAAMEKGRKQIGKTTAKKLSKILNVDYRAFL